MSETTTATEPAQDAAQDAGRDYEAEIKKLREESAKRRVENNELKRTVSELEPIVDEFNKIKESQKTEAEKQAERVAELEAKLQQQAAAIERQKKEASLLSMGIQSDVIPLLNVDSLDFSDAEKLTAQLAPFTNKKPAAQTPAPANGGQDKALTLEAINNMSREEMLNNWDAVQKTLNANSTAQKNKL